MNAQGDEDSLATRGRKFNTVFTKSQSSRMPMNVKKRTHDLQIEWGKEKIQMT